MDKEEQLTCKFPVNIRRMLPYLKQKGNITKRLQYSNVGIIMSCISPLQNMNKV